MRISDWSSDVCSSDLASGGDRAIVAREIEKIALFHDAGTDRPGEIDDAALDAIGADLGEAAMSRAIAGAVGGEAGVIRIEWTRLRAAGVSPLPLQRGLVRRRVESEGLLAGSVERGEHDAMRERNRERGGSG